MIRELFGDGEIWKTRLNLLPENTQNSSLRISFVDCLPNADCCEKTVRNVKKAKLEAIVRQLQTRSISNEPI